MPFSALPRYVAMVRAGQSIERPTAQLRRERTRIIAEYRELLGSDAERAVFDQMLGLCHVGRSRTSRTISSTANTGSRRGFYNKMREFGALLARKGVIDVGEDVFHLQHFEVDQALVDVMLAWAAGSAPVGIAHWKPMIAERKRMLERLKEWTAPPALGPMPDSIEDPAVQMLWGITSETLLSIWSRGHDSPDSNELVGFAASPGVVEGLARVLKSVNEIGQMRDGDPGVCSDRAELGPGVRQDSCGGIRHRRHHVARGDRGSRVRHACGGRHRTGNQPDPHRTAHPRRRRPRHCDAAQLSAARDGCIMPGDCVCWFAGIGLADRALVGGKGASLGELTRAGIRVPPGFVVTTGAFEAALAAIDPDGTIRAQIERLDPADLALMSAAADAIRERFVSAVLLRCDHRRRERRLSDAGGVGITGSGALQCHQRGQ